MRYKQLLRLQKIREWLGLIGWLLMIINLCIGCIALIISLITNTSLLSQPKCMVVVFAIAMLIGIMAASDGVLARIISRASKKRFADS